MRKHFHLSPRNAADSSLSLVNDKKINDIISKLQKSPALQGCPESEYNLLKICFLHRRRLTKILNILKSKM